MKKVSFACILILSTLGMSASADTDVRLIVAGCNNDTVCQPLAGEDYGSCPNDCTPAATTTPTSTPSSTPIPPGGTSQSGGTADVLQFIDFTITYNDDSVVLTWGTNKPTQSVVKWGLNDDYSEGTVSEVVYVTEHTTKISNIIPGRRYVFTVDARDASGSHVIYSESFFLKKDSAGIQPQNVESFKSYSTPTGIGLRWINPLQVEYDYVRILRSTKRFPTGPDDGKIVYEGRGQTVVDIDVEDGVQYYYAIFLRNTVGTYSSGVVLTATKYKNGITPLDSDSGFTYGVYPIEFLQSTSTNMLRTEDIDFIQNDTKISFIGSHISVDANLPLIVSIPRRSWSVAFLTLSSSDQIYLVGFNVKNNRLEAHIPPIKIEGAISYSLQIFYDGVFYQINSGVLDTFISETDSERENARILAKKREDWLILLPILVLLLILKKFSRKNKKTELK